MGSPYAGALPGLVRLHACGALLRGTRHLLRRGEDAGQNLLVSSLTPLIYWLEASVLTSLVGGSFGQLACRLRVVRLVGAGGRPLPLLPSLARHLLVLLVIPPLVFRPDGRGLHDLATSSAVMPLSWVRERSVG